MQVTFNPNMNYRHTVMFRANETSNNSGVYSTPETKKTSRFREDISKIAKFFTTLSEMTKATIKAIGYGTATAGVSLAGFWAFGALPQSAKNWKSFIETFKHPIKNISTKGKVISALAALGVATYHIAKGKLTTNRNTADIDHQLKTGHRKA